MTCRMSSNSSVVSEMCKIETIHLTIKNCYYQHKEKFLRDLILSILIYLFRLYSRSDPTQFLHLTADTKQQTEVNKQCTYVSSRFTTDPYNTWWQAQQKFHPTSKLNLAYAAQHKKGRWMLTIMHYAELPTEKSTMTATRHYEHIQLSKSHEMTRRY